MLDDARAVVCAIPAAAQIHEGKTIVTAALVAPRTPFLHRNQVRQCRSRRRVQRLARTTQEGC